MSYTNHPDNNQIKSYSEIKAMNPNTSFPAQGQAIVLDIWYFINPSPKPSYDQYTERVQGETPTYDGSIYHQAWSVVLLNLTPEELTARDDKLRVDYEADMNTTMLEAQIAALGNPAVHRYTQGMTRYTSLIGKIVGGGTPTTEELAFMDGAEVGLLYQETNALDFAGAVDAIALLSGADIVNHTIPDFTMPPATQGGYQPYLDYLDNGYV